MKTVRLFAIIAAVATLLAGCGDQERGLKVGAKNFGESRILAHMMATTS